MTAAPGIRPDSVLVRAPEFALEFGRGGELMLANAHGRLAGNQSTLRILEVFAAPTPLGAAIDMLVPKAAGPGAFVELMDQILALAHNGFLVEADGSSLSGMVGVDESAFTSLPVHIRMLDDEARTLAFQDAIRRTVKPGDVVVDIGTGTGILAVTAALAGARKVYAIEKTRFAEVASQVAAANGVADRVTVIRGTSLEIEIPEPADVIVSETIGNDPLEERLRQTMGDAARRMLKAGGALLPQRIRVLGLPVSAPPEFVGAAVVTPAKAAAWSARYGLDLDPVLRVSTAQDHRASVGTFSARAWPRLAEPLLLADIDLLGATGADIETTHRVIARNSGQLDGILVYFEISLGEESRFSIAPDVAAASNHWSSPVWMLGRPVTLVKGRPFTVTYKCRNDRSAFAVDLDEHDRTA